MRWSSRPYYIAKKLRDFLSSKVEKKSSQQPLEAEEPSFEEVVVFYERVFDLGSLVNPTDAARELLQTEFALSSPNYLGNEIEVATRFKELRSLYARTENLSEVHQRLEVSGIQGVARWVVHQPLRAYWLWRHLRSARASSSKRRNESNNENEQQASSTQERDIQQILQETKDFVDESMGRLGLIESLQRLAERTLFKPQYLAEIPFTRVELQPFTATLDGEDIAVDVGLLIHRSGVAILTFYVTYEGRKSARDLLRLINIASSPEIGHLRIARALLEPQARAYGIPSSYLSATSDGQEFSSGIEWLHYRRNEDPGTLVDIFDIYQTAIISAIARKVPSKPSEPWSWQRSPEWLIYPIVFVRKTLPSFSSTSELKRTYPRILSGIVQRVQWEGRKQSRVQEAVEGDLSAQENHSVYMEGSHATIFYHESFRKNLTAPRTEDIRGQDWLFSYFQTSVIIDVLLIERWILTVADRQINSLPLDTGRLNELKRELLLVLDEYHHSALSHGETQEIVRTVRKKMGTDQLYEGVISKLGILQKLIEVAETRRRAWRDRLLKAGTALVTVLFGLPAASRLVDIISGWEEADPSSSTFGGTVFNAMLSLVDTHSTIVTLALYIITLLTILPLVALSILPVRDRRSAVDVDQSGPAYEQGFTWQEGFVWRQQSPSENATDDDIPKAEK